MAIIIGSVETEDVVPNRQALPTTEMNVFLFIWLYGLKKKVDGKECMFLARYTVMCMRQYQICVSCLKRKGQPNQTNQETKYERKKDQR